MSMSIPFFYEPVTLFRDRVRCTDPGATPFAVGQIIDRVDADKATDEYHEHSLSPATWEQVDRPEASVIVDGGTLSNFPVWLFDADKDDGKPQRMTIGFTLTGGRGVAPELGVGAHLMPWPVHFGLELFHTASSAWDERFATHSTSLRTITVNAGNIATTQFTLTDPEKELLRTNGYDAATRYLDAFKPELYVNTYGLSPFG
jgi:predicted acylesterase/phospholipase RssA